MLASHAILFLKVIILASRREPLFCSPFHPLEPLSHCQNAKRKTQNAKHETHSISRPFCFMAQPTQPINTSPQHPKEGSRGPPTPPPAYAPPPRLTRLHTSLVSTFNRNPNMSVMQHPLPASVALFDQANGGDDEEEEESCAPIAIRISTALRVTSNHNLVCVTAGPADHAGAIAKAIIAAMKDASTANCGIPMIDEDGRPRPIRIEVDAGLDINGTANVIGTESVIEEVLRQRSEARKRGPPLSTPATAAASSSAEPADSADQEARTKRARSI